MAKNNKNKKGKKKRGNQNRNKKKKVQDGRTAVGTVGDGSAAASAAVKASVPSNSDAKVKTRTSVTPPIKTLETTENNNPKPNDDDGSSDVQSSPNDILSKQASPTTESVVNDNKFDEVDPNEEMDKKLIEEEKKGGDNLMVDDGISEGLRRSLPLFDESQRALAIALCSKATNQRHLFEHWDSSISTETVENDEQRRIQFMNQLSRMDKSYSDGGLIGYLRNARGLLADASAGVNPLDGWIPSVPTGTHLDPLGSSSSDGKADYETYERIGCDPDVIGRCGFVLVAGGLGERLGYRGVKPNLPTELSTETSYLQLYVETILAIQKKYASGRKIPLCIMVSKDTQEGMIHLLKKNSNFGLDSSQIIFVKQGEGVPALINNDAQIALDPSDPYKFLTKPHGHGDVHALLHENSVPQKWIKDYGTRFIVFFQDTNGLAFHTLAAALGVTVKRGFVMNSIATPRKAKQAIGGITRLTKTDTAEERTINIEYNQLDPLLRSTDTFPDGDVNDENTGYSLFPGNVNQLVLKLEPYSKVLEFTKGIMPEFVNPKYRDKDRTTFQKPTRLECMMQDFPTILQGNDAKAVGFTSVDASLCFSPVKNALAEGIVLQNRGTHPGVAASGESDQYAAFRMILRSIGCDVRDADPVRLGGIRVIPGPEVVLSPRFAISLSECKEKFPDPSRVKISERSSLVIQGENIVIESLNLDGALVIKCEDGAPGGVIRNLTVNNRGWEKVEMDAKSTDDEIILMRKYYLRKIETKFILFKVDGTIEGYQPPTTTLDSIPVSVSPTATPTLSSTIDKSKHPAKALDEKNVVTRGIPLPISPTATPNLSSTTDKSKHPAKELDQKNVVNGGIPISVSPTVTPTVLSTLDVTKPTNKELDHQHETEHKECCIIS